MAPANRKQPIRSKSSDSRYSLMEFMAEFPDDDACLDYLWRTRYSPDGEHAECPKCKATRVFKHYVTAQRRQSWTCTGCGHHVQPTAGTIFHKSSTSLHLWFYALYLITSTRCGISAKQLERELGVTYKTAWRMFNLIRNQLMAGDVTTPLTGKVEVDETYLAKSKRLGTHGRSGRSEGERTVLGMVERGGRVVARHVPDAKADTLMPHIKRHVLPATLVFTDEYKSYGRLTKAGYHHHRINHSAKVYVEGDVHTQYMDGFWSLFKRGMSGVYHSVSAKWLQSYLDEYAFRYNHREWARRRKGVRRVSVGEAMFRVLLVRAAQPLG